MAGSATFTIVMSRTIISMPVQRTARAASRRRSVVIGSSCRSERVPSLGRRMRLTDFDVPKEEISSGDERAQVVEELLGAFPARFVRVQAVQEGALLGQDERRPAGDRAQLDRGNRDRYPPAVHVHVVGPDDPFVL